MPKHDSASEPVRGGGGSTFIGHAATVRPASGNFFRQFLAARRLDVIKYAAPPIKNHLRSIIYDKSYEAIETRIETCFDYKKFHRPWQ